jgi:hypothetical protein
MVEAPTGRRPWINPGVVEEVLVLGRQEGVDDPLGDHLDRHEDPLLHGIFRENPAVAGVHPGHRRRIVGGQLLEVRQVPAVLLVHEEGRA